MCGVSQGGFLGAQLAMIRPDLVSRLVLAGSTLLPDSAEVGTGLATVFDGFPHVDELLAVVLQAGFGVDVRAANSSARDRAAGKKWVAVWKERYGAGHEKTSRMQGCLKQLLQRDDIVPRIEELETMVDVLHVSVPSPFFWYSVFFFFSPPFFSFVPFYFVARIYSIQLYFITL